MRMPRVEGPPKEKTRLGRPPRVTATQIAEAALEIGLDRATIRNVAERLGMSVPGLYHHVRTREDLLAMASAHSLDELPLPADTGQPAVVWLRAYARFVFDALLAHPEIVGQVMAGTVSTVRLAQHLEAFIGVLEQRGFTPADAYEAYDDISAAVLGAAVSAIGQRAEAAAGHRRLDDLARATKALGPEEVPHVAALVRSRARRAADHDPFSVVERVLHDIERRGDP